jgi:putative aminopeptidase
MDEINEIKHLLEMLTNLHAPSGLEQPVVHTLRDLFLPLADEVQVDAFGNLVAIRHGKPGGPRWMLAAHSDEVGGVVTAITPEGFLHMCTVGVIAPSILPAQRVWVNQSIPGVVVCLPGHSQKGENNSAEPDLLVDVGAESEEEVKSWGIQIGCGIVFQAPLISLAHPRRVMGKALDNRLGCSELLMLFDRIRGLELPATLYGVVTVQEETSMSGARMLAHRLQPDFAIALDTVPLDDTPLRSMPNVPIRMGHGPVMQLREGKMEAYVGTVAHPGVVNMIRQAATDLQEPLQYSAVFGQWTTDNSAISSTAGGIPVGYLSTPRRYGHTPNEMADLADALSAIHILYKIATQSAATFRPDFL